MSGVDPSREDDAVVDVLDVVLNDGAVLSADVVVTVADVPLIGIKLRAFIAGATTMAEYGVFEDRAARETAHGESTSQAVDGQSEGE